jgi:hypothetical protein
MESELYRKVYQLVIEIANGRTIKRATFFDADIVLTYMWAVLHDRPIYWACNKKNWPIYYRRRPLPTASTMTRRLRKQGVQNLLKEAEQALIKRFPPSLCRWIDAKPLPISRSSKDKQAGFGSASGAMAKGYKLYTIADSTQGFIKWAVRPMQHSESTVAQDLIIGLTGQGYLIGDGAYDKNHLYELAGSKAIQLLTPQRIRDAKGFGHRRDSMYRVRAMRMKNTYFGQGLLDSREQIERMYGQLTNLGCGLSPLPNWVRTLFRVEMWIRAKLIFYQIWRTEVAPSAA